MKTIRFSDIKPNENPGRPLTQADHAFAQLTRELCSETIDAEWRATLAPSKLPMCGWQAMLGHAHQQGKIPLPPEKTSFLREYYKKVGIVAHEVLQEWLGRLGYLYGPWECQDCKFVRVQLGTPKEPCECGRANTWKYVEFNLRDADPSGEISGAYIDGLIHFDWMEPDTYWLVDFKTCSLRTCPKPELGFSLDRHKHYLHQTGIYHHLLARRNANIVGTAFFMMPRDNPQSGKWILFDQNEVNGKLYRETIRTWEIARRAAETGDCSIIERDCETRYDKPECPFNKICFDRQATEALFKDRGLLPILPDF